MFHFKLHVMFFFKILTTILQIIQSCCLRVRLCNFTSGLHARSLLDDVHRYYCNVKKFQQENTINFGLQIVRMSYVMDKL